MHRPFRTMAAVAVATAAIAATGTSSASASGATQFVSSAKVTGDDITFPLYQGQSPRGPFWYVVIDANTSDAASRYGVNRSNKLSNARGTATQRARFVNGVLTVDAGVDLSPTREVVSSATGFPPLKVVPGSKGDAGYSPLVELPDGTVLNAPEVANGSGLHDKIVRIDTAARKVTLKGTHGFARGNEVLYVSTDASNDLAAALEGSTLTPKLADSPTAGDDSTASARASLAGFVNGRTGATNPERQGFNSAILDGLDPLNVLAWTPNQGRYSPLWDVHPTAWTPKAQAAGADVHQKDFAEISTKLVEAGLVSGPGGAPFAAANIVVNCPIVLQYA